MGSRSSAVSPELAFWLKSCDAACRHIDLKSHRAASTSIPAAQELRKIRCRAAPGRDRPPEPRHGMSCDAESRQVPHSGGGSGISMTVVAPELPFVICLAIRQDPLHVSCCPGSRNTSWACLIRTASASSSPSAGNRFNAPSGLAARMVHSTPPGGGPTIEYRGMAADIAMEKYCHNVDALISSGRVLLRKLLQELSGISSNRTG